MKPRHPLASLASRESFAALLALQQTALEGNVEECLAMGSRMWADALGLARAWAGLIDESGEEIVGVTAVVPADEESIRKFHVRLAAAPASQTALGERHAVFLQYPEEWFDIAAGPIVIAPAYGPLVPKAVLVGKWERDAPPSQDELDLASLLAQELGFSISTARRLEERATAARALETRVHELEKRVTQDERARRLSEETGQLLRRASNRLHVVIEQLPEGLAVVTGPGGSLSLSNQVASDLLAPDKEGKIGATFLKPDSSQYPRDESPLNRAFLGETFGPEEVIVVRPGRARRKVTMTTVPMLAPDGRVTEAVLVMHEEGAHAGNLSLPAGRHEAQSWPDKGTELPREEVLGEQILEVLVESAPLGVGIVSGPDHRFEMANRFLRTSIGPLGASVHGRAVEDVFPTPVSREIVAILEEVYASGRAVSVEEQNITRSRDRDPNYWDVQYLPIFAPNGQVGRVLILAHDATERVAAREHVAELSTLAARKSAEFANVLENMTDAVFVCDSTGYLTLINDAGKAMLGLGNLDIGNGKRLSIRKGLRSRHLDGKPVTYDEQPLIRALKGEHCTLNDAIIHHHRTGKEIRVRTSASPIRDEGGWIIGAVAVTRDVTALVELDHLKDEFISVAAHELKTPITIIKGYSQLMLRAADRVPPDLTRMLETIARGATRVNSVVQEILMLPELQRDRQKLTLELVDLLELAQLAAQRIESQSGGRQIVVRAAGPVPCNADRFWLEQVIENLLTNAIKYSPSGAPVEIEVSTEKGQAVVAVRDQGVGIPESRQQRVFDRFYTAHIGEEYDFGGIGLGLYISKDIITRHGGSIWFESEEGQGSSFFFSLPAEQHV